VNLWLPPYQAQIADLIGHDPAFRGRVLDIGCGGAVPACLTAVASRVEQLDGVDPSADVLAHPGLVARWQAEFEASGAPTAAYDAAYAYNVVEHVRDPVAFLDTLARVLKPGGVFWAVTPNGHHPFCLAVRTVERLGLKRLFGTFHHGINDYPAYYRLNRESRVRQMAERSGFVSADFYYFAVPGWERGYFPSGMRWIGRLYDSAVAGRFPALQLVVAYRLERGASPSAHS
jgi:SAM-dependent methyltransferase